MKKAESIASLLESYHNTIIENFCQTSEKIFIAGGIHNDKDLKLISGLANKQRDTKFIIVPHEISEEILNDIKYHINGYCLLYSECDEQTDFKTKQVLVIDFLGALPYIYKFGTWAYVGGGFTPNPHNVLDPAVYGLPTAFGPKAKKGSAAKQMIDLKIGTSVRYVWRLNKWFADLKDNQAKLDRIRGIAQSFVEQDKSV